MNRSRSDSTSSNSSSSSTGSLSSQQRPCCLTPTRLFFSCCLLVVVVASLLTATYFSPDLRNLTTPCTAVLGLAIFLTLLFAVMAAFVERKLQHHYIFWRIVYLVICIFFIDEEERKQLMRGKNQDEKLNPSTGGSVNYGSDMGIKETVYTRSTQSKMAAPKMKVTQS